MKVVQLYTVTTSQLFSSSAKFKIKLPRNFKCKQQYQRHNKKFEYFDVFNRLGNQTKKIQPHLTLKWVIKIKQSGNIKAAVFIQFLSETRISLNMEDHLLSIYQQDRQLNRYIQHFLNHNNFIFNSELGYYKDTFDPEEDQETLKEIWDNCVVESTLSAYVSLYKPVILNMLFGLVTTFGKCSLMCQKCLLKEVFDLLFLCLTKAFLQCKVYTGHRESLLYTGCHKFLCTYGDLKTGKRYRVA